MQVIEEDGGIRNSYSKQTDNTSIMGYPKGSQACHDEVKRIETEDSEAIFIKSGKKQPPNLKASVTVS